MSDERTMFDYEPPPTPPPRWFYVANIVVGVVMLWMYNRVPPIYERVGYHKPTLERIYDVLLPVAMMTLGASGLVKRLTIRRVVGAISLAALAISVVTFVASFFTE